MTDRSIAASLGEPHASARALGYRMPAEWEPLERVWLTPPFNPETWPGCLPAAQEQFSQFMTTLGAYVEVATTTAFGIETDDSWIRDFGPIFVVRDEPRDDGLPRKALHDFRFNGWGGKYEVRVRDDAVPQQIATALDLPIWMHEMVLEGGSIEVNGRGTVMTTSQCLLNPNRNPGWSRARIEHELHEALGTSHVIWLPGGIVGDDTDGHIDDIARFVAPSTVVSLRARPSHPDYDVLERNWQALHEARDERGGQLTIVELPVPEPILYDFPPDRFGPGGRNPVPASYANFLIANGAVLVPVFGQPSDERALRIIEEAMPGYTVVGLRAETLVVGLGAFHCLSQHEPK